jgi:hypothetical protein
MIIDTYIDVVNLKEKLNLWLNNQLQQMIQSYYVVSFSYGNREKRCQVWSTGGRNKDVVIKRLSNFIDKYYEKNRNLPEYLKFDIAMNIQKENWMDVVKAVEVQPHNNHYRKGISFAEDFSISFLEQEIYGKAIIKGLVYNQPNFFDEKNLNDAIKAKYPNLKLKYQLDKIKQVWTFDTISTFYEHGQLLELNSFGSFNGARKIENNKKEHIEELILTNAHFLHQQIKDNGQFIYGYFPAFDREINSYNTVRHCTSLYALLETLEVEYKKEYLEKIILGMQYTVDHFYQEVNDKAYIVEGSGGQAEIKLGANAAAIFMFSKYQELTQNKQYQKYAEKLANGILSMINTQGETTHVLHYPSLELKEKFRIVYYDGEAALGLLRLYQLNNDPKLLNTVKLMFEHFISKSYEKHHDHWLSYCTNELTKICPEEKYYQFGLNNYLKHMNFIRERKTAYSTFLEMMMSAYKMVTRMEKEGLTHLLEQSKFNELKDLIEWRVEFQRSTGYFYPEMAMYMAKPEKILNAFYVRHDRFRTRIDDQEHNLSGFVAYLNYFK